MKGIEVTGGAVVSGSFQGFDQAYLKNALRFCGPNFVGVTQLPATVSDKELINPNNTGIRAIKKICELNPATIMFGTDLPSTRSPKAYSEDDLG